MSSIRCSADDKAFLEKFKALQVSEMVRSRGSMSGIMASETGRASEKGYRGRDVEPLIAVSSYKTEINRGRSIDWHAIC